MLEVVDDACSEARLAEGLKSLVTTFAAAELSVAQHGTRKDSVILVGMAPLVSGLEDAQLTLSSIASSRYAARTGYDMDQEIQLRLILHVLGYVECLFINCLSVEL